MDFFVLAMVYVTSSKDKEMSVYDNCYSDGCHVMSYHIM